MVQFLSEGTTLHHLTTELEKLSSNLGLDLTFIKSIVVTRRTYNSFVEGSEDTMSVLGVNVVPCREGWSPYPWPSVSMAVDYVAYVISEYGGVIATIYVGKLDSLNDDKRTYFIKQPKETVN